MQVQSLQAKVAVRNWNADLEYGLGIRTWNADLECRFGMQTWNMHLEEKWLKVLGSDGSPDPVNTTELFRGDL